MHTLTVSELAAGLRARKFSSLDLTLHFLGRIERLGPELNAFVTVTADRALAGADQTLVGKDSPTQQELRAALQEVSLAARAITELVDYLERNPNALIRGTCNHRSLGYIYYGPGECKAAVHCFVVAVVNSDIISLVFHKFRVTYGSRPFLMA